MHNISIIEEAYQKYIKDLADWVPDGIDYVNLELLHQLNLLHFQPLTFDREPKTLTHYFHIVDSLEKITLINEAFVVWIIPDKSEHLPSTYVLIALNKGEEEPQLQSAFVALGVYNNSKVVMQVLEKFLGEIQENEQLIASLEKT